MLATAAAPGFRGARRASTQKGEMQITMQAQLATCSRQLVSPKSPHEPAPRGAGACSIYRSRRGARAWRCCDAASLSGCSGSPSGRRASRTLNGAAAHVQPCSQGAARYALSPRPGRIRPRAFARRPRSQGKGARTTGSALGVIAPQRRRWPLGMPSALREPPARPCRALTLDVDRARNLPALPSPCAPLPDACC